jgi:peptidoglycan-N-acetylglucosamine deacetylase
VLFSTVRTSPERQDVHQSAPVRVVRFSPPRLTRVLALGIGVAGLAAVAACTTAPGGGEMPVAAPTSATAEHRAVSPLDEPTGTTTASASSSTSTSPTSPTSTAPPTVTVTSVRPTTSKSKTATTKPTPKTTTTTKAKPKPTTTPTPKATATPKPTTTKSTTPAPKTPATGPAVTGCGNPNPGKVLLTFDDGGPKAAAILAILDRYRIKARWFPTGQWANANGGMIQRLIADGQMLGNHTYSHPQMLSSLGRTELNRQVDLGYHPTTVFRFPYGASDATSRAIVSGKGYSICGWSIDTLDWRGNSADAITRIVTSQAGPGSVVLMHMSSQADVDALPRIIENLRSRGLI